MPLYLLLMDTIKTISNEANMKRVFHKWIYTLVSVWLQYIED